MSTPLRGTCPACGKRYRLGVKGDLYRHEATKFHDQLWVLDQCSGSFGAPIPHSVSAPRNATKTDDGSVVRNIREQSLSWWDRHWPAVYAVAILVVGVGIGYTAGIRGWHW